MVILMQSQTDKRDSFASSNLACIAISGIGIIACLVDAYLINSLFNVLVS